MTWANNGLPPTSCRTLGCFDLRRVPLPAAMIAIATRGLFLGVVLNFGIRTQYTVRTDGWADTGGNLSFLEFGSRELAYMSGMQLQQIVSDARTCMARHSGFLQIIP